MARDIVKVREVGQTLVVTLTHAVLEEVKVKAGDKVLIESVPPRRIIISKEEAKMPNTKRTELELELLENQKTAKESEIEFLTAQHNLNMPVQPGAGDASVELLSLRQLEYERDRLAADISQKRLELFDLQGA